MEQQQSPESYTAAITELEELVRKMQDNNCDLDSLAKYTVRAKVLITYCRDRLTKTDEQLKSILKELESNNNEQ